MSLELSIGVAEAVSDTFIPADHLLGIVQQSIASQRDTRIILRGEEGIVIFPKRGIYYANVSDMVEFCRAPKTQFETKIFDSGAFRYTPGSEKKITDLLWLSAFHVSQGRLIEGRSKYDVVQLRHWPNLTRLPVTPNAARICALLTRHPTTIMLVHRVLGIDKEEVCQIYSSACSAGIAHMVSRSPILDGLDDSAEDAKLEREQGRGILRSLFAKISRL